MNPHDIIAHRAHKDTIFRQHPQSPLTDAQKRAFTGLSYFDANAALALTVAVREFDEKTDLQIDTTQDRPRFYRRWGDFTFDVDGEAARLTIYQTPNGFFLPFVDALAGMETYPAGRYLEPQRLDDKQFLVDFNQAYNPFCAYNEHYDCPITPLENRLSVPIRAGEKMPKGDWVNIR